MRGDARRDAQAIIIAMGHDDPAYQPRGNAPAGRMRELLTAISILVLYPCGFCEVCPEIVRSPGLQRLAILHHGFDRPGLVRSWKTLVLRLLASDHRQRQVFFSASPVHLERAMSFR